MRNHSRESGQALIEYTISVVVFLALTIGVLDLGRAVYTQNILAYSARRGARYALTDLTDVAGIEATVEQYMFGLDPSLATVTITTDVNNGWVDVEVTYPYTALTPFIVDFIGTNGSITLRSQTHMHQ